MADPTAKVSENVEGTYFVDDTCIACEACIGAAPDNFKMNDDDEYAFVFKQPENDDETAQCEDAVDACPVDAIGKE
jgi:ferredoxin